ncbi:MAG: triple tyrosine motif-containing protein, partial [Ginsengibacter sp.]
MEAGFNSREAMGITSTPNGLIWVTSNDGFARYDGKRFKFYQHIPGEANSLISNYCTSIQADKAGRLWIISGDNLEVFDTRLEQFYHLKIKGDADSNEKVNPTDFYYDEVADNLWITTKKGLYFSERGSLKLKPAFTSDSLIGQSYFTDITPDGDNNLWLTTALEVCKINRNTGNTTWINMAGKLAKVFPGKKLIRMIRSFMDDNKILWIGTWQNGLLEYNTVSQQIKEHHYRNINLEENVVNNILPDEQDKNLLWLSAAGFGFTAFNKKTGQFKSYASNLYNAKEGIMGNTYGFYRDKNHTLWIGSETGLHKYDRNKQLFSKMDLTSISNNTTLLPPSSIGLQHSPSGKDEILWMEIPYKGGFRYDLRKQQLLPVPKKLEKYLNPPTGVFKMHLDKKNILYVSTNQYGLVAYDIEADKMVFNDKQYFIEKGKWATIFLNDSKNNLWIGTYDGLYILPNGATEVKEIKIVNEELKRQMLSTMVQGVCEDNSGRIWFTTDNSRKPIASIGNYDAATDKIQIVYNEKKDADVSGTGVDLREIVSDNYDNLYVSNWGAGLGVFSAKAEKPVINYFSTAGGMNSNYINYLQKDSKGNIWCSSALGISCYKPADKFFVNFSQIAYGMGNTADAPIYFSPNSENLYISQHNAISYCNTNATTLSIGESNFFFSEFSVFNKSIATDFTRSNIIRLQHSENMISFEFALLSYTNSSENRYSWLLKGIDKDWNLSKENIATYSNLQPGTYTFMVKAANSQGHWIKKPLELTIIISPPFYKTWWFISICVLCCIGIAFWFMQQRINRIKSRYQLRNKIASDLHDEIGSTLTSISILSNVSQQALEHQPDQAKEMLKQISVQSK